MHFKISNRGGGGWKREIIKRRNFKYKEENPTMVVLEENTGGAANG
jgi:hypothetical protein